jgi:hypothetical protein
LVKASIVFSVLLSSVAVMPVGAFAKSLIHVVDSRRNGAQIRFSGQAVVNLPPVSADVGSAPTGSFQA